MIRAGLLWLALAGGASAEGLLAVGDSVMAWNGAAGIPERVGTALDLPVTDRSQGGARVSATGVFGLLGVLDIRRQVVEGGFDWAILNGGANDLMGECGCGGCGDDIDRLVAADGSAGEIHALVRRLRRGGETRVAIVGYYGPSPSGGDFDICADELATLDARLARLAARDPGVVFADTDAVMAGQSLYDADNVHPSAAGSAAIAQALVAAMRAAP